MTRVVGCCIVGVVVMVIVSIVVGGSCGVVLICLVAEVSVGAGGGCRLSCRLLFCVRCRLRCSGVCRGAWRRRLIPSCPAVLLAGLGLVRAGLVGARHRNPCGRWVGQWCQGMGGWHGQHHVMDERMAPQLWQGSVAHLVGVVSLRVAWLVWALHLGHISG